MCFVPGMFDSKLKANRRMLQIVTYACICVDNLSSKVKLCSYLFIYTGEEDREERGISEIGFQPHSLLISVLYFIHCNFSDTVPSLVQCE